MKERENLFEMLKIILYYYYIILSLFGRQQINFVAKHEKKTQLQTLRRSLSRNRLDRKDVREALPALAS